MKKHRWLVPAILLAAIAWHVQSVAYVWGFVGGPTQAGDFASYYYAASVALAGGNPYDSIALNELAGRSPLGISAVQPFFYPPPFLMLVAWAPSFPIAEAYHIWFWFNELILWGLALVLHRGYREQLGVAVTPILALTLAASPALVNLTLGQVNLPVMLAVMGGLFVARSRPLLGGALVGWACMMKMSPALFVVWWMLRGRWREVAGAGGCALILSLMSLPLLGVAGQLAFYRDVLPGFASGNYNGLAVPIGIWGNHSLPNLFHQWLPGGATLSEPARILGAGSSIAMITLLAWSFRKPPDRLAEAAQIAAVAILTLLIPVYTYEHHLVWAVPGFLIVGSAVARGQLSRAWLGVLLPAFLAWGVAPEFLKALGRACGEANLNLLALGAQEAKFIVLLILGGLATWLGSRPAAETVTRESS